MKKLFIADVDLNVGDSLNPAIYRFLNGSKDIKTTTKRKERGKFVGVGSIMSAVRSGDSVFGTGIMRPNIDYYPRAHKAEFLAVRGKKTRDLLIKQGVPADKIPKVYGDPALLLPLIYDPQWDFGVGRFKVGYIPHYIEQEAFWEQHGELKDGELFIDTRTTNWKSFVRKIKSCDKIVSSSLHGLVIAEAYGIPAEWVSYGTGKIVGGDWKHLDYFTGTGRIVKEYGLLPTLTKSKLEKIQKGLIKAYNDHQEKSLS